MDGPPQELLPALSLELTQFSDDGFELSSPSYSQAITSEPIGAEVSQSFTDVR